MRVSAHCAAMALILAAFVPYAGTAAKQAPKGDAAAVLASARQALGGEKKLTAVKTLTATGRTRQVRGENLVPIEFEIFVELPDKYLRKDEVPAQESGPNASGFNGDELLQDPPPATPPAAPAGPRPNMAAARVTTLKQDVARLMLGLFAASWPSYPLTFTYVAEAEAPQGKADVLEGKGAGNFTVRFFISRESHLPLMVTWTAPAPPGRGAPGARAPLGAPPGRGAPEPAGAPGARGGSGAAQPVPPPSGAAPPVSPARGQGTPSGPPENRLYFADYRDVDGLQLPFRLRRAVGADTVEETTFDGFKLNAKIDPRRFEVRK